jgi:hypothetical protein
VVSIPVFAPAAAGTQATCTQEQLAAGIRGALAQQAKIINISASEQADLLSLSKDLSGALQEAATRDVPVVASAGNQGCACDTIPASVPGVLAVGAHGEDGVPLLSSARRGCWHQGLLCRALASAAGSAGPPAPASRRRWCPASPACS